LSRGAVAAPIVPPPRLCFLESRPLTPPLFPYTTLFRSAGRAGGFVVSDPEFAAQFKQYIEGRQPRCDIGLISRCRRDREVVTERDRKSTRLNSSHVSISYAVFCLKKKNKLQKQEQTAHT